MSNLFKQLFCAHEFQFEDAWRVQFDDPSYVFLYIEKERCKKCGKVKKITTIQYF